GCAAVTAAARPAAPEPILRTSYSWVAADMRGSPATAADRMTPLNFLELCSIFYIDVGYAPSVAEHAVLESGVMPRCFLFSWCSRGPGYRLQGPARTSVERPTPVARSGIGSVPCSLCSGRRDAKGGRGVCDRRGAVHRPGGHRLPAREVGLGFVAADIQAADAGVVQKRLHLVTGHGI